MAKKPKMALKSKVKISWRELPEIDPEVKKPKASAAPAPRAAKVKPVPMAKPVGKITPRVESRVRALPRPAPRGELALVPNRLPAVVKSAPKPVVGGLSVIRGAIERTASPLGTANATGSAIRGSRKLFGALTGGKARALGYIGASVALPDRFQPALSAAQHGMTARELTKAGAKAAFKQVGKKAIPVVGLAFAAAEVANAGIEGYRAIKAQRESQRAAEVSAVKYASPLVHQQFLRARAATQKGAMPDSVKTDVPNKSAGSAPSIKPGRSDFGSAFSQARKAGQKAFEYKGKQYNTQLATQTKKVSKAPVQTKETMTPVYDSQSFVKTPDRDSTNIVRAGVEESASKKPFKINFGAFLKAHPKYKP